MLGGGGGIVLRVTVVQGRDRSEMRKRIKRFFLCRMLLQVRRYENLESLALSFFLRKWRSGLFGATSDE